MEKIEITKEWIAVVISILFLVWNSILDIRKRKISLVLVGTCILLWLLLFMMDYIREDQLPDKLLGILPGLFLLITGIVSRGALGLGDGILVIPVGLYMGIRLTVSMVLWAFFLAFFWGILMLCFGKKKKEYAFPFAPFLCVGFILALVL